MHQPAIYIAGPDLFVAEPQAFYQEATALCEALGLQALCPYNPALSDPDEIFVHNLKLLRRCDGVVANVEPFRGAEADSGTCFEIGVAYALHKPVVAYLQDAAEMFDKALGYFFDIGESVRLTQDADPAYLFPDHKTAETWGYPVNLMLQKAVTRLRLGDLKTALITMGELLNERH